MDKRIEYFIKIEKYLLFFTILVLFNKIQCSEYHDYLIIGAGPSGLQMGSYLQQKNRDYLVLEKGNSSEFFPDKDDYVKYLNDFTEKLKIKVRHHTNIVSSQKINDDLIELKDEKENKFSCKYLIISTGLFKPNKVSFIGSEHAIYYDDMEIDPTHYEGKSILILGKGNTAHEVANSLIPYANFIHMGGRSRVRLSWATHYVGDLRAINNNLLDNYQLKSLDGIFEIPVEELSIVKTNKGRLKVDSVHRYGETEDNFAIREEYDYIISCLGWKWDGEPWEGLKIRKNIGRLKKFPKIDQFYEADHVSNVFFTGVLSHSLDFRKSAGGFIHGYRYTTRALHRLLEWKNHGVPWPHLPSQPYSQIVPWIIKRVNEASGPYQMFQILGDVLVFNEKDKTFEAFEEYPLSGLDEFVERTGKNASKIAIVVFEYGDGFSGPENDPFRYNRSTGAVEEAHLSNFLHPVIYFYKGLPTKLEMDTQRASKSLKLPTPDRLHHIVEDFLTTFDARQSHIIPVRRFFEYILKTDLRVFSEEDCIYEAFTGTDIPSDCHSSVFKDFETLSF